MLPSDGLSPAGHQASHEYSPLGSPGNRTAVLVRVAGLIR